MTANNEGRHRFTRDDNLYEDFTPGEVLVHRGLAVHDARDHGSAGLAIALLVRRLRSVVSTENPRYPGALAGLTAEPHPTRLLKRAADVSKRSPRCLMADSKPTVPAARRFRQGYAADLRLRS